jgi:choline dehydrogenase-like flavoprotein
MASYDFIIVGGGSSGCVLANKLSRCGNYSVCLIEAGPKDKHWAIHLPIGIVQLMSNKRLNWLYSSKKESTLNHRNILNPRGKTLGGSSSINAMLYVRGQKQDYDHWEALGNEGWTYDDVLPYFKSTQHQEKGESYYHGADGELNVAESRAKPKVHFRYIEAAKNLGFKLNNDFNGENQEGVGFYQMTQKNGVRCSASKAFIKPITHRKNLTVLTNVQVNRVIIDNKKAVGIEYTVNNKVSVLYASKEVILSAGAFNSPQLLMLSGVGPRDELVKHNIELIHELPGVGENLQDHIDIMTVARYNYEELIAYRPKALWWMFKESFRFITKRTGILTSAVAESGGFIKSSPNKNRPDLQLHFIPAAMDNHGINWKMLFNYGVSLHACLLRPKSRGRVTLHNKDITSPPNIHLNMLSHPDDSQTMIDAVKVSRQILQAAPLNVDKNKEIFPGVDCQSDEDILNFIKTKANTIYHPVGTCKMGKDEMAVVDNELNVHGISSLRVVDCSIMPTIVSGNTNAPAIMIAAKISDIILKKYNQHIN